LSDLGIEIFPLNLFENQINIEILDVSHNNLFEIDNLGSNFKRISFLDVSYNKIRNIPSNWIYDLKITHIDFGFNLHTEFPKGLDSFQNIGRNVYKSMDLQYFKYLLSKDKILLNQEDLSRPEFKIWNNIQIPSDYSRKTTLEIFNLCEGSQIPPKTSNEFVNSMFLILVNVIINVDDIKISFDKIKNEENIYLISEIANNSTVKEIALSKLTYKYESIADRLERMMKIAIQYNNVDLFYPEYVEAKSNLLFKLKSESFSQFNHQSHLENAEKDSDNVSLDPKLVDLYHNDMAYLRTYMKINFKVNEDVFQIEDPFLTIRLIQIRIQRYGFMTPEHYAFFTRNLPFPLFTAKLLIEKLRIDEFTYHTLLDPIITYITIQSGIIENFSNNTHCIDSKYICDPILLQYILFQPGRKSISFLQRVPLTLLNAISKRITDLDTKIYLHLKNEEFDLIDNLIKTSGDKIVLSRIQFETNDRQKLILNLSSESLIQILNWDINFIIASNSMVYESFFKFALNKINDLDYSKSLIDNKWIPSKELQNLVDFISDERYLVENLNRFHDFAIQKYIINLASKGELSKFYDSIQNKLIRDVIKLKIDKLE